MPQLYRAFPICLLFLGAVLAPGAHAATLTVTSLANAGPGTLRDQVAAANPGDTIVFSVTGTIQLAAPSIDIAKDLTITGPGTGSLILRGVFPSGSGFSIFALSSGTVGLSGLTLANGTGNNLSASETGVGGAILQSGGTVTVTDCLFSANRGSIGGAIYLGSGSLSVANSTFSGNNSALEGGAIHMAGGSLAVTTTTFSGNIGRFGGGIFCDGGTAVISNSTFSANIARSEAIDGQTGAYFGWGGGVFNTATMTVTNCTFSGNISQGNLETVNAGGGGIRNLGTMNVSNCTITSNSAQLGGGIYSGSPGTMNLTNSIVAGNSSSAGSDDIYAAGPVSGPYNVVAVDPKLGPLTNNGGPTRTHAPLIGSPALDAGDPNFDATNLPYDQRGPGFPRIKNGRVCCGAFENELNQNLGNIVVNSLDDHDDGIPGPTDCTLREAVNHAAPGATITFNVAGTIALTGGELVIARNLTVQGPTSAPGLTVSGGNASRIFSINATSNGLVNFSHLTLSGGNGVGSLSPGIGGAINIETASMVSVANCTFSGNSANAAGAIKNGGIRLTVTNSTFTGNAATNAAGGAIRSSGELFIFHSTIVGNSAAGNAGGIMKGTGSPATFQLSNSIVAGNTATSAPDINGTVTAGDYNLVQNPSGLTFSATHYLTGLAPQLSALADHGGPTRTMRPQPGSPVLNAGSNALIPNGVTLDQRGFARVDSGTVDIGAFEVDATLPTVTLNQASGQTDPTISAPVRFTVVFSEPVTGFTTGDVTLGGTAGATTAFVTGSGTTYEIAVSGMTRSGTVLATIAAGVAQDFSSNLNAASTSADNSVFYYSEEAVRGGATIQPIPAAEGGGYAIGFLGNPGAEYTVQFASQLSPADWQTLRTQVADASGAVSFVDHPPPGTPRRFYRQLVP